MDELRRRLPEVEAWLDGYLAPTRHAFAPLDLRRFSRLAGCFSAELLGRVRVATVARIELPPFSGLGPKLDEFAEIPALLCGITYRDRLFVLPQSVESEVLHFHLLVHAAQWVEAGSAPYLLAYADHLRRGGYARNPLENMAYALEARFERGEALPNIEAEVRRETRRIVAPYAALLERGAAQ